MKKVVLAEKPSVARDIARVLGANGKRNLSIMEEAEIFVPSPVVMNSPPSLIYSMALWSSSIKGVSC